MDYLPFAVFFVCGIMSVLLAHFVWTHGRGGKMFRGALVAFVAGISCLSAFLAATWWYLVLRDLDNLISLHPLRLLTVMANPAFRIWVVQLVVGLLLVLGIRYISRPGAKAETITM